MIRIFNLLNTNNKKSKDINHNFGNFSNKVSLKQTNFEYVILRWLILQKTSLEDSNVRLKSYNNGSFCVDNDQYNRNNHYIKQTKSNRINDHIILLKRRVTQQQFRHNKNQITTFQETTYELPSSVDLVLMSRRKESLSSRHYEMKQSSCVVC
ncbi:unnamed protein product [Rotaria magnacalcarata]|uniref:Uncharacterized protein n=1 Tax=Rotaria magnacalcarata TaxID=392030 RepID=A0A815VW67_9BILA|nr:unnamed protein product [Rotaria magnacalcarata]CAF3934519.1 unnamed protein product [Rotaria magnacalcarata]CAF3982341.1 unnamed protein product [Rotaria magnacalcarata]